jgi:uncharacterized protein DUF2490
MCVIRMRWGRRTFLAASVLLVLSLHASAPAQDSTAGEFWPQIQGHLQLPANYRMLLEAGLKNGEEFGYQQLNLGAGIGRQWKVIGREHLINIDPDKEHYFLAGAGYERVQTLTSGATSEENRLVLQGLFNFRLTSRLLLQDRNRIEFRWVNGVNSTRYRNYQFGQYDFKIHQFRFSPYASAEEFYTTQYSSWNEAQYAAGIEWPYRRLLMLQTYYLRQNCSTCNPGHVNVAGLTLNLFF